MKGVSGDKWNLTVHNIFEGEVRVIKRNQETQLCEKLKTNMNSYLQEEFTPKLNAGISPPLSGTQCHLSI